MDAPQNIQTNGALQKYRVLSLKLAFVKTKSVLGCRSYDLLKTHLLAARPIGSIKHYTFLTSSGPNLDLKNYVELHIKGSRVLLGAFSVPFRLLAAPGSPKRLPGAQGMPGAEKEPKMTPGAPRRPNMRFSIIL